MIVEPYVNTPTPPTVALLLASGEVVDEHGEIVDLDDWPATHRLWASYETVYQLVRDGVGEALCWNNEEIRWRHERFEDDWKRRPSDANVIKLPFDHLPVEAQLQGFATWRDWLKSYGASPTGTSGAAAWSLLRATLARTLITNSGERPPLMQTVGGRQELGPAGQGRFDGELLHLDLPAAYASTLAGLKYGGVWLEAADERGRRIADYAGADTPVFVHAKVAIPDALYGPLVKRSRRRLRGAQEAKLLGSFYPTGVTMQGFWTWEELRIAELYGVKIQKVLGGWVHRSGWRPFTEWWTAIQKGRDAGGLAGTLAKMTGNALWGRFCMDPRSGGRRTIRSMMEGGGQNARLASRPLTERPAPWPAHDLAETVSGRVRAELYRMMEASGDRLLTAHTDGVWLQGADVLAGVVETVGMVDTGNEEGAWRLKDTARRIDLLDPQVLRYWPLPSHRDEPFHVVSGVPAERAPEFFAARWQEAGFAN